MEFRSCLVWWSSVMFQPHPLYYFFRKFASRKILFKLFHKNMTYWALFNLEGILIIVGRNRFLSFEVWKFRKKGVQTMVVWLGTEILSWNITFSNINVLHTTFKLLLRPVVASGTRCDCKTDWLWVRSPLEEVKDLLKCEINTYFHFFALVSRSSLQNSAESGQRSVLTLGSLCLPCCVRDTAWS